MENPLGKKICIVTTGSYSDYSICAVFSSRELAEPYAKEEGDCEIEEWPIDAELDTAIRTRFYWTLHAHDGSFCAKGSWDERAKKNARVPGSRILAHRGTCGHFSGQEALTTCFYAEGGSYVSAEHAAKCAAEIRQAWLREGRPDIASGEEWP